MQDSDDLAALRQDHETLAKEFGELKRVIAALLLSAGVKFMTEDEFDFVQAQARRQGES